MRYFIETYGCQMNKSNSERMAAILESLNFKPAWKEEEADLIIVNACSVRQSAVDRIYGKVNFLTKLKMKNKNLKIVLTGCILKEDKEKLEDKFDLVIENKQLSDLFFQIKPKYQTFPTAYVPISTGCNNFCSYCVVPYTWGKEKYRRVEEIIEEVKFLIKNNFKLIILLGQNVNSYKFRIKNKKTQKINFPKLLEMIDSLEGDFWLCFLTSHPKDLSEELIEVMATSKKIIPYLHLPVQSGNNKILKKMNRGYTVEQYKRIIQKIRSKIPQITISTDIIVGFPGETKKQFEDTLNLMKEIKFDQVYIAQYSPRKGTSAYKLKDDVSKVEKKARWKILNEELEKIALENNKKMIGKEVEVLIEETKNDEISGKTKTFKNIKIIPQFKVSTQKFKAGDFIKAKVTEATPWGLAGKLLANNKQIKL